MDQVPSFQNDYSFLSNFYPAEIEIEGVVYPTSEHAYQAMKTTDKYIRSQMATLKTPAAAKKAGNMIKKRADWDIIKLNRMERILRLKFSIPELKEMLLATDNIELIERNNWNDTFWGVCNGRGENWLGKLLMKIRQEVRNG